MGFPSKATRLFGGGIKGKGFVIVVGPKTKTTSDPSLYSLHLPFLDWERITQHTQFAFSL
jgi:hypothetical protein